MKKLFLLATLFGVLVSSFGAVQVKPAHAQVYDLSCVMDPASVTGVGGEWVEFTFYLTSLPDTARDYYANITSGVASNVTFIDNGTYPNITFPDSTVTVRMDLVSNAANGTYPIDIALESSDVDLFTVHRGSCAGSINYTAPASPDFTAACSPATTTITAGSSTSFNYTTTGTGGFSSAVTVSASFSPSGGTLPTISYSNNGVAPNAVTSATIATTSSTTPATYTVTLSGTGGGITKTCNVQLVVNAQPTPPPAAGSFTLSVSPSSGSVLKGGSQTYTVTANCTNLTGPITNLAATSPFTGLSYSFSSTTVACGASVTLTIGNTGSVPSNQLSTPQTQLAQTLTVTGQAAQ